MDSSAYDHRIPSVVGNTLAYRESTIYLAESIEIDEWHHYVNKFGGIVCYLCVLTKSVVD